MLFNKDAAPEPGALDDRTEKTVHNRAKGDFTFLFFSFFLWVVRRQKPEGWRKRRMKKGALREIITGRETHYPQGLLLIAPLTSLQDVGGLDLDLDPALPPWGCWHLSSADDSSV